MFSEAFVSTETLGKRPDLQYKCNVILHCVSKNFRPLSSL